MKLSEKIITLRKQKGWSQEELAYQMGVSRQAVSKWESDASTPDLDKVLKLSKLFGTTTDYLLKEDVEENNKDEETEPMRQVTKEEVTDFLLIRKSASLKIAIGVWLCIISPITLIVLAGLSQFKQYGITENAAAAIGLGVLLPLVAIAVILFIVNGMAMGKYEFIEKEAFVISSDMEHEIKEKAVNYAPKFTRNLSIGVALCIVAAVPVLISSVMYGEKGDQIIINSVAVLLLLVSIGVFIIVKSSIIKGGYDQLLQQNDYTKTKKEVNKTIGPIGSIYWTVVTAAYLIVSFATRAWDITWVIWMLAGVVYGAFFMIMENKYKKNDR